MRESRFKQNCEPLTPLGKVYRGKGKTIKHQPIVSYDELDETNKLYNELLQEIQGFC